MFRLKRFYFYYCRHLKVKQGTGGDSVDSAKVADFKRTVEASLRKRVPPAPGMAGKVALLASALDPRHKSLRFLDAATTREAVRNNLVLKLAEANDGGEAESEEDVPPCPVKKKKDDGLSSFFGEDYAEPVTTGVDEVLRYTAEPCIPLTSDPLVWWDENRHIYPKLAKLAFKYLCVPATSVPAERVFSAAGLIISRLRSRLSPEHVDMLISLNKNE